MKIALVLIGFVGAGLVGAVAARELFTEDAPVVGTPPATAAIEARVDDLSAQVARLTQEVRARRDARILPSAPPPSDLAPDGVPEAISGEAATSAAPDFPAAISDDQIEKKVVETVEKMARARAAEKARRDELATRAKERAWLVERQKVLGLTDYQVDELAKMLISRRQRLTEYTNRWRAAPEEQRPQVREEMMDYRRGLDAELRKLLSADQYDGFMKPQKKNQKAGQKR